jgi:hypothetical protein
MNKLIITTLLFLASTIANARVKYEFKLELDQGNENFLEYTVIQNVEDRLDLAITLSINNPMKVEFSYFENSPIISCINGENLTKISGDIIHINKEVLLLIESGEMFQKQEDCHLYEAIKKSLEIDLLIIPGSDDLSRELSRFERKKLKNCRYYKRSNYKLKEHSQGICDRIITLGKKRRQYRSHSKKLNTLAMPFKDVIVDHSSLTGKTLSTYNICESDYKPSYVDEDGRRVKMLAFAAVYFTPAYGTHFTGHLGERFIYCVNDKLYDYIFEFVPLEGSTKDFVLRGNPDLFGDPISQESTDYVNSLEDGHAIYINKFDNPTESISNRTDPIDYTGKTAPWGYNFSQINNNRDVLEIYPTVSEEKMFQAMKESIDLYNTQVSNFKNRAELPLYKTLANNCSTHLKKSLSLMDKKFEIDGIMGVLPRTIMNSLHKRPHDKVILYPSQRRLRKMLMVRDGKSLWRENITFASRASKEAFTPGMIVIYPETHGFIKNLILKPISGIINFFASLFRTAQGAIEIVVAKNKERARRHFKHGKNGIVSSAYELLGIRGNFPSSTPWRKSELEFLDKEEAKDPKILDYLYQNLNK